MLNTEGEIIVIGGHHELGLALGSIQDINDDNVCENNIQIFSNKPNIWNVNPENMTLKIITNNIEQN